MLRYKRTDVQVCDQIYQSIFLIFFFTLYSMAVMVNTEEERVECLKSVADSIIVAMALADLPPAPFVQGTLEKRKSKMPEFHSR